MRPCPTSSPKDPKIRPGSMFPLSRSKPLYTWDAVYHTHTHLNSKVPTIQCAYRPLNLTHSYHRDMNEPCEPRPRGTISHASIPHRSIFRRHIGTISKCAIPPYPLPTLHWIHVVAQRITAFIASLGDSNLPNCKLSSVDHHRRCISFVPGCLEGPFVL